MSSLADNAAFALVVAKKTTENAKLEMLCPACGVFRSMHALVGNKMPRRFVLRVYFECSCGDWHGHFDHDYSKVYEQLQVNNPPAIKQ